MWLPVALILFFYLALDTNSCFGYSVSQYQDIKVSCDDGILQCDQIVCPEGTARCHVIKKNSIENPLILLRANVCYDADGGILQEKTWSEETDGQKKVNLNIFMYRDGRSSLTTAPQVSPGQIVKHINQITASVSSVIGSVGDFVQDMYTSKWF